MFQLSKINLKVIEAGAIEPAHIVKTNLRSVTGFNLTQKSAANIYAAINSALNKNRAMAQPQPIAKCLRIGVAFRFLCCKTGTE